MSKRYWFYLFCIKPYINVCCPALFTLLVAKRCIDSLFSSPASCGRHSSYASLYFSSLFSSPAALLSCFFYAALFTLLKILPLFSPLQYPVLSPFSLPQPILFSESLPLFSAPSIPPPISHLPSSSPLQPPNVSPACLSTLGSSLLVACVGKVAEGGVWRLAALAQCIIHVPCSLCGSRSSAGFSLGHMGLVKELCVQDTGPDGRAAQMGLSIP